MNESTRLPVSFCLTCGARLDAATDLRTGKRPSPGDISVCIKCGAVMTFAHDLTLRGLTQDEARSLMEDAETMRYLGAIHGCLEFLERDN